MKTRIYALLMIALGALTGWFIYSAQLHHSRPFKLGLDLSGGTHLVYDADVSKIAEADVPEALTALQTVILRRVDAFGVGEPLVQAEQGGALGNTGHRLIVELPGVTDVNKAIAMIGATPVLEFKLVKPEMEGKLVDGKGVLNQDAFVDTGLTGKYLTKASLQFGNGQSSLANEPMVTVTFNSEGSALFGKITQENVGHELAIFLDGKLLSAPVLREPILDGTAVISGHFTADAAKEMVRNLNLGALPVPITLASTQSIGATLGEEALHAGLAAGIAGFIALSIFLIFWYRLPGVVAVSALAIYTALMLALFQILPVVLTAAGIAAFILSVGLAVDANILIAERMKEEINAGKKSKEAIEEGFKHAWTAIRDSNIAHVIASIILFWLGTNMIKGFALVFGLGVLVSLFSAITISRTFLLAIGLSTNGRVGKFLMRSGFNK